VLSDDVCFVSTMLVSNETGAINNIGLIREIIDKKSPKCILHVDAVQAFCKINFNVIDLKIDLCSISAHKINGIKGVGALYVSKKKNAPKNDVKKSGVSV
jgi:cysteine desulfurase